MVRFKNLPASADVTEFSLVKADALRATGQLSPGATTAELRCPGLYSTEIPLRPGSSPAQQLGKAYSNEDPAQAKMSN